MKKSTGMMIMAALGIKKVIVQGMEVELTIDRKISYSPIEGLL